MKKYLLAFFLIISVSEFIAQTVSGKIVNQTGQALSGLQCKLYIGPKIFETLTNTDGTFLFNKVSDIKEEQLPSGYTVSDNYPNPFNPKTRIGISVPQSSSVNVDVYNLLGQRVIDGIKEFVGAGNNFIDLELAGLPNGIYLARVIIDGRYSVTRKLLLMYGSQHLSSEGSYVGSNARLGKYSFGTLETKIDSLVVSGTSIARNIFKNLPTFTNSLNLGNLIITTKAPEVPVLLSPNNNELNVFPSVTFIWKPSDGALSYSFQVSTSSNFSALFYSQSGISSTSLLVSGLSINTQYYWRVSATNVYGDSPFSSPFTFRTGSIPQTPILSLPSNNAIEVLLNPTLVWNKVNNADTYTLTVASDNSFSNLVYNQGNLLNTNQPITGLNHSSTYYWRVNATNTYGTSSWSNIFTFKTLAAPSSPTLVSPSNNEIEVSLSPTLTWSLLSNADSYAIQVSKDAAFTTVISEQSGLTNAILLLTNLDHSSTYYWRVRATNIYGNSSWSNVFIFKTLAAPIAPTLVEPLNSAVGISLNALLKWNKLVNATNYTLQLSTSSSFTSYILNQEVGNTASKEINGLLNNTTHYWRVNATNNFGSSSWSEVRTFTTTNGRPCPGVPTVAYEGKIYNTVQIGAQCWLKENLDVGTMLLGNQEQTNNSIIEKNCYSNDVNNCATYGGLYQWAEVVQYKNGATNTTSPNPAFSGNIQGICPSGWHLPTLTELELFKATVSNDGNALKAIGQGTGSGVGTNISGFAALLNGYSNSSGIFSSLGGKTYFWSSTEYERNSAYFMSLWGNDSGISIDGHYKDYSFSVRCVKD